MIKVFILIISIAAYTVNGYASDVPKLIIKDKKNESIVLRNQKLEISEFVSYFGEPSRVDWPIVLPVAGFAASDLIYYYPNSGVILRFFKERPFEKPIVKDIFLFRKSMDWNETVMESTSLSLEIIFSDNMSFCAGERINSIEKRDDVLVTYNSSTYFWNPNSGSLIEKVEREAGIPLPNELKASPSIDGQQSRSIFIEGLQWEVNQFINNRGEIELTRLVYHGDGEKSIFKIKKDINLFLQRSSGNR